MPFPGIMRLLAAFSALVFLHPLHFQFLSFCWVHAAISGLAFRILSIPSSSPAGGFLAFAAFHWFMRLLVAFMFMFMYVGS